MIFRRLILAALAMALLVGILQSSLQQLQTLPIIRAAEKFENQKAAAPSPVTAATDVLAYESTHDHGGAEAWEPADGIERQVWTFVANVLHAFSMALLMLAVMAVCQWRGSSLGAFPLAACVTAAGWFSLHFWPSLGLPAEIPGMDAGRLASRQGWWMLAAGCAALACASVALMRGPFRWVVAAGGLALPYVVGAPDIVADLATNFTGETRAALHQLSSAFFWATTWLSLSFWVSLGMAGSLAFERWLHPAVATLLAHPNAGHAAPYGNRQ